MTEKWRSFTNAIYHHQNKFEVDIIMISVQT